LRTDGAKATTPVHPAADAAFLHGRKSDDGGSGQPWGRRRQRRTDSGPVPTGLSPQACGDAPLGAPTRRHWPPSPPAVSASTTTPPRPSISSGTTIWRWLSIPLS